jgi:mannosyl-oligosaccharide glucosidase
MRLIRTLTIILLNSVVFAAISPDLINAVSAASNASLLWGPYRPNLYFGIRPRLPKSLLTGLLWTNVDDYRSFQGIAHHSAYIGIRHSCEIGDDMASYGWTEYDGRNGGKQIISDRVMKLDLETQFIKVPGQNGTSFLDVLMEGGNWGVRIKGRTKTPEILTNIFFYAGLEGFGDLHLTNEFSDDVLSCLGS